MTDRRYLPREQRKRLVSLSRAWAMRAGRDPNGQILAGNAAALDNAIKAADEAELQLRRFERAELILADLHREIVRVARIGKPVRRIALQRLAQQIDEVHDILRRPD